MTPERFEEIRLAFDALIEHSPAERKAALEKVGEKDPELRNEVEKLLAASGREYPLLDRQSAAHLLGLAAQQTLEGRQVGAYRIDRRIAAGGMGTVFEAHRTDDVFAKRVAVKVCTATLVGETIRDRFRRERRILARLEHPKIARILDGGTTDEGSPYFVMEYVDGLPLNRYLEERRLGLEERLRLFCEVCEAVAYAHRNLVVHRDLKPSNILVDAAGCVKLLDFGIAKLLAEGTEAAPAEATRTLLRALTPEYAAPEQVRGDPVTTATDVYALGVVLYELLTGQRPYRVTRSAPSEWEHAILEQEPLRPSARAAGRPGMGESEARDKADGLRLQPTQLRRRLRGDLDRIVLKALQKEPERRYASAEALAADIRRHLEGLPVSAHGDSLTYRGVKFLRRHRVGVAAAALVFLSLIAGLAGTAVQARRATREARKASAVKDFLKSLFSASDPAQAQGKERTAKQLLDDGARRIETELKDQPDVQSEVARLIASVYSGLGEYDRATPLLRADIARRRRLEGPKSVGVAESLTQLADVLYDRGRFDEASPLYEEALGIQRGHGERSPQVAELLWDIAGVKRNRGDLTAAEALQKQSLAIYAETRGSDSSDATAVRESLAVTYSDADRYADALAMNGTVVDWRERHYGSDHPDTLNARYNQATYLLALGRMADASHIAEDVVARQRRVLGARHDRLAVSLRLLARTRDGTGRTEDALAPIAEALAIHRASLGPTHWHVALDLAWQGVIEGDAGRLAEAERDCRLALDLVDRQKEIGPINLGNVRSLAGSVLAEAGRLEEADRQLSEAVAVFRSSHRSGVWFGRALNALGDVARRRGQTAQAVELGREALAVLEKSGGADHPAAAVARVHVGAALWAAGQSAEGERLLRAGLGSLEREFPDGHFDLASARFLLGQALAKSGRVIEARPLLQQALEWRQAHLRAADPRTAAVRRALLMEPDSRKKPLLSVE
jgi:serine/threonine protein kinase